MTDQPYIEPEIKPDHYQFPQLISKIEQGLIKEGLIKLHIDCVDMKSYIKGEGWPRVVMSDGITKNEVPSDETNEFFGYGV